MSKSKKETSPKTKKQKHLVVDPSKILTNLEMSGYYVVLLQQCLTWVLSKAENAEDIMTAYEKTNYNIAFITDPSNKDKKPDKGPKGTMNPFETTIYTLTTLIQYLRAQAGMQDCTLEVDELNQEELKKGFDALLGDDYDNFKEVYEKIMENKLP